MTKSKGLGRGLDALLGSTAPKAPTESSSRDMHPDDIRAFASANKTGRQVNAVEFVHISDIEANPNQPRQHFEEAGLRELAESIEAHGLIQPITLRRIRASKYQIISGERRFRAAQRVGLTSLPAYIREADDRNLLEMALVENIQREDLNPVEVSLSFQHLMEECGLTQEVLAQRVGKGRSTVANYLRILELPDRLQQLLRDGKLNMGHVKALAGLKGPNGQFQQIALAEKAVAESASVRTVERWVQEGGLQAKKVAPTQGLSDDERQALDRLRLRLSGTSAKVTMTSRPRGGGKLTLQYADMNELEAIFRKLGLD